MRSACLAALLLTLVHPAAASAVVCPGGFLEVVEGATSLGCIQQSEEAPSGSTVFPSYFDAESLCAAQYGGRLPTTEEAFQAVNTLSLTDLQDDEPEWLQSEILQAGSLSPTCSGNCAQFAGFSFGAPDGNMFYLRSVDAGPPGRANVRCFIPAAAPAMATVPAINGPLVFTVAGALAGYWLAHRRRYGARERA